MPVSSASIGKDSSDDLRACPDCDWLVHCPPVTVGECARCPRCNRILAMAPGHHDWLVAWSATALILLALSLAFPFVSFEAQGIGHTIDLFSAVDVLLHSAYWPVALLVAAVTLVLPAVVLAALLYLGLGLLLQRRLPAARLLAHALGAVRPWVMSDVFLVGVLVSLIKIISLAEIRLEPAFLLFALYGLALLRSLAVYDRVSLWNALAGRARVPRAAVAGSTATAQGLAACEACGALDRRNPGSACTRCGHRGSARPERHLQVTWALLATALLLYLPAMLLPVMSIREFGSGNAQTIVQGAWYLAHTGSWPIALVIFAASVVVPLGKMLSLGWLCVRARMPGRADRRELSRLYRLTERIGRWSMIDVFVVAVLAALIQAGEVMRVDPRPGIVAFAAVVIVTMAAARAFDHRSIWRARDIANATHCPPYG